MPRFLAIVSLCALIFAPPVSAQAPGGQGPKPVGVITLEKQAVPFTLTVPGRAVAFQESLIRPQVSGIIEDVVYDEGADISTGDIMFRINDDTYAADVRAAEAMVARAESALQAARNTLSRTEQLRELATSEAQLEDARVGVLSAEAELDSALATLELARLDLERTEITSPIDGEASVAAVSVGAVVTARQAEALATVTRLDPIYVDLVESSARVVRIQDLIRNGAINTDEAYRFDLILETGDTYDQPGKLVSQSAGVSTTTGTAEFRVRFPNPEHILRPGQFLRVDVTLGTRQAFLVPQRAARRNAEGVLTFYLVRDGKAEQIRAESLGVYDNAWIVAEGIEPGERLVVDGLTGLRSGAEVAPQPVTLTKDGVTVPAEE
ncbi:efflux RND transporter periplasmic adaptor subunit [Roseovarius aestuariivivens]|uniref:efflux RND transporter periplasmic adaptor subunit n=1 Tax=Roseovarius aestuariivivens TaxID=1888910 RepID=UPI001080EA4B|nr:efflux RND transporter periplasmic adaptor subunit [Roseovarius aestuariivivens]